MLSFRSPLQWTWGNLSILRSFTWSYSEGKAFIPCMIRFVCLVAKVNPWQFFFVDLSSPNLMWRAVNTIDMKEKIWPKKHKNAAKEPQFYHLFQLKGPLLDPIYIPFLHSVNCSSVHNIFPPLLSTSFFFPSFSDHHSNSWNFYQRLRCRTSKVT